MLVFVTGMSSFLCYYGDKVSERSVTLVLNNDSVFKLKEDNRYGENSYCQWS